MSHTIYLTDDAAGDLEEITAYIAAQDSAERALYVLGKIQQALQSLSELPHRGAFPRELLDLGIRDFREVFFKPYRILYRVMENDVFVMLIADGRRDLHLLLQRRLLQG